MSKARDASSRRPRATSAAGCSSVCRGLRPAHAGIVTETTPCEPRNVYERTKLESDTLVAEAAARQVRTHDPEADDRVRPHDAESFAIRLDFAHRSRLVRVYRAAGSIGQLHIRQQCGRGFVPLGRRSEGPRASVQSLGLSARRSVCRRHRPRTGRPSPRLRAPAVPMRLAARAARSWPCLPLTEARVAALTQRARYACDAIVSGLGYEHRVSMEEGLEQMVARWREMQNQPRIVP